MLIQLLGSYLGIRVPWVSPKAGRLSVPKSGSSTCRVPAPLDPAPHAPSAPEHERASGPGRTGGAATSLAQYMFEKREILKLSQTNSSRFHNCEMAWPVASGIQYLGNHLRNFRVHFLPQLSDFSCKSPTLGAEPPLDAKPSQAEPIYINTMTDRQSYSKGKKYGNQ